MTQLSLDLQPTQILSHDLFETESGRTAIVVLTLSNDTEVVGVYTLSNADIADTRISEDQLVDTRNKNALEIAMNLANDMISQDASCDEHMNRG